MNASVPHTFNFQVTGMSCEHCENAIREEVALVPGVSGVEVNAKSGELHVAHAAGTDIDAVIAAVDEAGYTAVAA